MHGGRGLRPHNPGASQIAPTALKKNPEPPLGTPFCPPDLPQLTLTPSPPIHPQGPRGLDKLVHDDRGTTTISNDGATIMKLLDIVHPAAKSLVDIAKSQDSEVGDGTTTVVILAGEFLRECKPFVEDGVHPQNIIKHFREAAQMAIARVKSLSGEFIFISFCADGVLYFRTGN